MEWKVLLRKQKWINLELDSTLVTELPNNLSKNYTTKKKWKFYLQANFTSKKNWIEQKKKNTWNINMFWFSPVEIASLNNVNNLFFLWFCLPLWWAFYEFDRFVKETLRDKNASFIKISRQNENT